MYGRLLEMRAFALACGVLYSFGLFVVWPPKNAATSLPLQWHSGTRPRSLSSFSRRSVIEVSVGHLSAMSPSSVLNVCAGSPSTRPPPSTPRMAAVQPYSENALLIRCASAYAELPHRYFVWSLPVVSSSNAMPSTGTVFEPYG